MGWIIIHDSDEERATGMTKVSDIDKGRIGKARDYKGGTLLIRTGDDDGNHYYTALCDDDESMEAFFDWSMADSGCSWSEYWCTKDLEWKGFIS